jgi:Zn-dependent protease
VYPDPDEPFMYREYGKKDNEIDYTRPDYYHPTKESASRSAQPVQPLDPYAAPLPYVDHAASDSDSAAASVMAEQMTPYRGPSSIEGYTTDIGAEQREVAKQGTAEGTTKGKGLAAGLGGLVAIGAALLKIPGLAFVLKFGFAGLSAIVSVFVYSLVFGWRFAVGLVVLLFIHEMGHALVMKLKGIPIGGLIFIPMLGAAVTMRQMPQNAKDEAEVGIAGPIAGAMASGVCLFLAQVDPNPVSIWAALAYFGFFLNLFNLIPIVPFDGGRVLAAIDRRVWIVGFVGLLAFQIWQWINGNNSIWLLFFIFMAATQLWSRRGTAAVANGYYDVPVSTRIALSVLYFGLAAVLVLGMSIAHNLIGL